MDEGLDAKLNNVDIKNRVPDRPQTLEIAEMANNHLAKVLDRMEYYQPSRKKLAPQLRAFMNSYSDKTSLLELKNQRTKR